MKGWLDIMVIDFHTHIFPEKIADRALQKLASVVKQEPTMNGTIFGLQHSMEQSGVDLSVVLPIVTDPHQFSSIFRFAVQINKTLSQEGSARLVSLASVHPMDDLYREQLLLIKQEGFAGIKIHPNYQGLCISDIRYKRLLYAASELGLLVVTHAGYDPYTPTEEFCSPDMILDVLSDVAPEKFVLAHMGSNENYDEAEEKLVGKNVYLDTAYSITRIPPEQFARMVHRHGADKILFATDAPWASQADCVQILQKAALTDTEKNKIFSENARLLLGL